MTTVPISMIRKTGSEGPSGRRPSGRLSFFLFGHGSAMRGVEPRMALGSEVHVSRSETRNAVPQGGLSYGTDRRGADLLRKPSRCRFASRGGCAFLRSACTPGPASGSPGPADARNARARSPERLAAPGVRGIGSVLGDGRDGPAGGPCSRSKKPKRRKRKLANSAGSGLHRTRVPAG